MIHNNGLTILLIVNTKHSFYLVLCLFSFDEIFLIFFSEGKPKVLLIRQELSITELRIKTGHSSIHTYSPSRDKAFLAKL